jgi:hypothetical protein
MKKTNGEVGCGNTRLGEIAEDEIVEWSKS